MRFTEYLKEGSFVGFGSDYIYKDTRSKNLDIDKAIKIAADNCKDILKIYKSEPGKHFYRGTSGGAYKLTDPGTAPTERISAYADYNYYTILINNLPAWKDYPKRAIVGSTGFNKAMFYGNNLYIMLPFDGSKIAICPSMDIFGSFSVGGANYFNTFLHNLTKSYLNRVGKNIPYKRLEKFLKSIDKTEYYKFCKTSHSNIQYTIRDIWDKSSAKTLFDLFNDYCFNPKKEGF